MTHDEIQTKAIIKAQRNGLDKKYFYNSKNGLTGVSFKTTSGDRFNIPMVCVRNSIDFFFSHEFAQTFWGVEGGIILVGDQGPETFDCSTGRAWQSHLQIMVLEEDPIKYLEKFL